MPYHKNVFINCPFDNDYYPLLNSLIFTVLYLDFVPRLSQTRSSSRSRVEQIMEHIDHSMYGIHDLSRSKALKDGDLPRFNMPYELGLDVGCHRYGGRKHQRKKIMILERDSYHYHKVLSDISGQDIFSHNDSPKVLIQKVRNWFSTINSRRSLPGPVLIWDTYQQFLDDLSKRLRKEGYYGRNVRDLPIDDFVKLCSKWLRDFRKR
jgi:hypothetical protein